MLFFTREQEGLLKPEASIAVHGAAGGLGQGGIGQSGEDTSCV